MLILQIVLALAVYDIAKKLLTGLAKVVVEYGCKKNEKFLDECLKSYSYALSDLARRVDYEKKHGNSEGEEKTIGFNR